MTEAEATETARWDELARKAHAAEPAELEEVVQLLALEVAGDSYAVPVESVREIVRMRPITPIPRVTSEVCGIIALRGEILQVVDLRCCLGLAPAEATRSSRIVVIERQDGCTAALLVDAVHDVLRAPANSIVPASGESAFVDAICSRGETFVSLVAIDRVMNFDVQN